MNLAAIRKATYALGSFGWTHGDDCPHRHCDDAEKCADGSGDVDDRGREGCENPGIECDCAVAAVEALLEAIDAPPAPHPFAALLRDNAALVALSRALGPMTPAERVRALLRLGAESDLYEGTPQPGHNDGCAMAGWPFEVSPCGCGPEAEAGKEGASE